MLPNLLPSTLVTNKFPSSMVFHQTSWKLEPYEIWNRAKCSTFFSTFITEPVHMDRYIRKYRPESTNQQSSTTKDSFWAFNFELTIFILSIHISFLAAWQLKVLTKLSLNSGSQIEDSLYSRWCLCEPFHLYSDWMCESRDEHSKQYEFVALFSCLIQRFSPQSYRWCCKSFTYCLVGFEWNLPEE